MNTLCVRVVLEPIESRLLLSAGDLDASFGNDGVLLLNTATPTFASAHAAVQSDGKIVLAGVDTTQSSSTPAIVRLNTDGTLDKTFGTNGQLTFKFASNETSGGIADLAIEPDGEILAAGGFGTTQSINDAAVARITTAGKLDTTFGGGDGVAGYHASTESGFFGIALAGNKIVLGGQVGGFGAEGDFLVARLNSDGTFDKSFHSTGVRNVDFGGPDLFADIATTSDGKIIAVGRTSNGQLKFASVRLTASGDIDRSFGSNGRHYENNFEPVAMFLNSDGKILVAGKQDINISQDKFSLDLYRFTAGGNRDAFGTNGHLTIPVTDFEQLRQVIRQTNGDLLLAGAVRNPSTGVADMFLTRTDSSGKPDATFGNGGTAIFDYSHGSEIAESLALDPSGDIFADVTAQIPGTNDANDLLVKFQGTSGSGGGGSGATLGADGTLTVNGTDGNDNINVNNANPAGDVTVVLNGATQSFIGSQVKSVVINGLAGNDTFFTNVAGTPFAVNGGDGNDHFSFRNGDNTLNGGAGDDYFTNDDSDDDAVAAIDGGTGNDTEEFGGVAEVTITMGANLENFISHGVNVNGNDLNNTIDASASVAGLNLNGGVGNDRIIGGSGNDTIHGGTGNDTITGGTGSDDIFGDGGSDTDDDSSRGFDLNISLDNVANDGPRGHPGELDNVHSDIETVLGGSGADKIIGNPFANKLIGNAGNDTIFGGDGNDTLIGGPGTDVLDGQGGTDVVTQ